MKETLRKCEGNKVIWWKGRRSVAQMCCGRNGVENKGIGVWMLHMLKERKNRSSLK